MPRPPPRPTLFPYTTLFRSVVQPAEKPVAATTPAMSETVRGLSPTEQLDETSDRKSTRLNSSHLGISYAVFCLKKKRQDNTAIDLEHERQAVACGQRDGRVG